MKKMFKKMAAFTALTLAICLLMTACDPKTDPPGGDTASTTKPTVSTEKPTAEATTEPTTEQTEAPTPEKPAVPDTPSTPDEPDEPNEPAAPETPAANTVAALAEAQVGKAFAYGKTGPDEFDNSGLVYYCLKQNGIDVPRRTGDQFRGGTAVAEDNLQAGDLVFYWMETEGAPQYVGIYLGNGSFVAANKEDNPVCVYPMSMPYFQARFVGAVRYTNR